MKKFVSVVSKVEKIGKANCFSRKTDEFKELLELLGCDINDYDEEGSKFEIYVVEYKDKLDFLKKYKEYKETSKHESEIADVLDELDIEEGQLDDAISEIGTLDDVIQGMERLWDERDKDWNYIILFTW